jgi:hypothetical protein
MRLALVAHLVEFALVAWLAVVAAFVVVQMLRGRIPLAGLFEAKTDPAGTSALNLDRHQLLILSVGYAVYYVVQALHLEQGSAMPDVPSSVLYLLAGSQAVYLGGKIARSPGRRRKG